MDIKKKISKKLILRLAIFIAVIGVASLFDVYFDNHHDQFGETSAESTQDKSEQGKVYFVSQANAIGAKTSIQKIPERKLKLRSHDKLIQKYHQLRNNQVLKAETETQTTPLILSYHYLIFKEFFYSGSDDVPLVS